MLPRHALLCKQRLETKSFLSLPKFSYIHFKASCCLGHTINLEYLPKSTMEENNKLFQCIKDVKKVIVAKGERGRKPNEGSVCSVVINVVAGQCAEYSELLNTKSSTFAIGNHVDLEDKIVEYCVTTMTVGEESVFEVKSENLLLSFSIKLDVCFFKPYIFQMSEREKLSLANKYKQCGVELFQTKRIVLAFYKFGQALKFVLTLKNIYPSNEPENTFEDDINVSEVTNLRVNLYNNLASCQLHFNNHDSTIALCTKSLKLQPNVKAYYRRSLSYAETMEYEKAESDLLELIKMEPQNKAALDKLALVRELDKDNRDKYKTTMKKMFKSLT